MSKFGRELVESAEEALAIAKAEKAPSRMVVPAKTDVAALRRRLGLTQAGFAARYGLNVATVRDWEQNRRQPDQPARVLLKVIENDPEAVERALA
ncbi:helix-turn-helix domain-containing protein [Roseitalea porphyridii]|uniref:Helix-turn-helix domain-containing protein n=1 Tax=Roseitalea porphyridii TaxID=1852022 RepID=A0A4V1A4C1_9HYPH|nr:helix-turn-helix domain-containing protein [Roseitalea porphyridii]QBK32098.1 helix-turn-helix domain-containing protein [Roseitalea porphyridii]